MQEIPLPTASRQTTAREFLVVVFRRKWLILGLFLIVLGTVLIAAFTQPVIYQSTGRVLVKRGERESALEGGKRILQWEEDLASEVQVVQSETVIERAQQILNRERGSRPQLRIRGRDVGAEVVEKSNVILIAYSDRDPQVAKSVAGAMVRGYMEYRNETYTLPYPAAFFEGRLGQVGSELARLTEQRRQFATATDAVNPIQESNTLLNHQQMLSQRLTEIESELASQRSSLDAMRHIVESAGSEVPFSSTVLTLNDNAIAELKRQIVDQEMRLAQLRERYLDGAPEVKDAQKTLETLRSLIASEMKARISTAESQVRALEAKRAVVLRDLAEVERKIHELPTEQTRLEELDRRILVLRDSYQELSRRSDQARIAQATSSNITVVLLAPAGRASVKNARDYVRLALAPAFSLLVGLGLAFFVDSLDTTVRTTGHAEEALEVPVLAILADRRRRA